MPAEQLRRWVLHVRDLPRLKPLQVGLVRGSCLQGGPRRPVFLVKKKGLKSDVPWGPGFEVIYGGDLNWARAEGEARSCPQVSAEAVMLESPSLSPA